MSDQLLYNLGVILISAGVVVTFVAAILLFFTTTRENGKVRTEGAIIIGPFPVVFGTDRESVKILFILSIALITIVLTVTIVFNFVLK